MMRSVAKTVLAGLVVVYASGLTGCVPLMVGGAVMGGMVATDRRTSGTYVEDEAIELKAAARVREQFGERVHINITSYNRQVLLTGEAPNAQDRQSIEQTVSQIENVRNAVNEIAVLGNSTLTQRSSDALVTGRIKAKLLDARDLQSNSFKIVTERGVAYLMGRVTEREANRATEIITATQGVQKLVRVLEILTEEELARLQPPARAATAKP
ncbi:MAG: transporter [Burkholderiales bacterium PBB4]|nr:MAG: transporter [Burkholderiales bacterium PBB4]